MGLPNKFGCRQPPTVVEEPLIVLQAFAPRNLTSKLMLTILGGAGARDQAGEAARAHRQGEGRGEIQGSTSKQRQSGRLT
jgi:hypothetical protein